MRLLGFLFAAAVAMALFRLAAAVVALLLLGFIVVAAIRDPMQTFGCLFMFLLLGAIGQYPLVGLIAVCGMAVARLLRGCQDGK